MTERPAAPAHEPVPGLTSVIVVAADSGPLLVECVAAVLASTAAVELLLVDNASADGVVERIAAMYAGEPRVAIVRNDTNIGFGPAVNQAFRGMRGDTLLVLNPDCRIEPTTIERLRRLQRSDDRIGLVGVHVLNPDGTSARGNRRRDPTLRRSAMEMSGLARWEPRHPAWAGVEIRRPPTFDATLEDVDAVSGACLLLPRAAFQQVGGFDEAYFLHVEDLDLCRRVREAGLRVVYARNIDVVHEQGSSSRRRPLFVLLHKQRGMWRYFVKFDPAARNPWCRMAVGAALVVSTAVKAMAVTGRLAWRRIAQGSPAR